MNKEFYCLPPNLVDKLSEYCKNNNIDIEYDTPTTPIAKNAGFIHNYYGLNGEYENPVISDDDTEVEETEELLSELENNGIYTGSEEIVAVPFDKNTLYTILKEIA